MFKSLHQSFSQAATLAASTRRTGTSRAVADSTESTLHLTHRARLGESTLDGRHERLGLLVDVLRLAEHVGDGREGEAANHALQGGVHGCRGRLDDVLLGEDTLDDAGATTDGLKEARVDRDDDQLGLLIHREGVGHRQVELEGEVADQRWRLARLEGDVFAGLEHERTTDQGDQLALLAAGVRATRRVAQTRPGLVVLLQAVLDSHEVQLLRCHRGQETREVVEVDRQRLHVVVAAGGHGEHVVALTRGVRGRARVDDEQIGDLGERDGLALELGRAACRQRDRLGQITGELHVRNHRLRGQRHIQRGGQELHVDAAVLERALGRGRVVRHSADGATSAGGAADNTGRGGEQVHDQLDVVNAEQTGVHLVRIGEHEGGEHQLLRGAPLQVHGIRATRAVEDGDAVNSIVGRTGVGGGRRAESRTVGVREDEVQEGTVWYLIVGRGSIVAAQRVVQRTEGIVVQRVLVQHRRARAHQAVLLLVRQTEHLGEHILGVNNGRGVVDGRGHRGAQGVQGEGRQSEVAAGNNDGITHRQRAGNGHGHLH